VLRDFAYLLAYSEKAREYGLVARLVVPLVALGLVFYVRTASRSLLGEVSGLLAVFTYELVFMSRIRGLKSSLSGLRLYVLFTALSSLVFVASSLLGMLAPDPTTIPVAALRLVVLFTALTLLLQVVSFREWTSILRKLGLKFVADLYALVLLQLPVVVYYLSESAVTVKLKYKGRRLHKIAIPLILLTTYTSRSALESYLIYGEPPTEKLTLWKRRDAVLYVSTLLLVVLVLIVLSTL
jgi:hypothetical protein